MLWGHAARHCSVRAGGPAGVARRLQRQPPAHRCPSRRRSAPPRRRPARPRPGADLPLPAHPRRAVELPAAGRQHSRRLPVARAGRRSRGAAVGRAAEHADAGLSRCRARQAGAARRGPAHRRVELARPLRATRSRGSDLRAQERAAEAAAHAGHVEVCRRARVGAGAARSERARSPWSHQHRLLRAVARRQEGRGVAVARRQRKRHAARARRRLGRRDGRRRALRQQWHRGRQRRLERGRQRLLLHPSPASGRAPARGPRLLPADLLPPHRHRRVAGPVLPRPRLSAHCRDGAPCQRRRQVDRGLGAKRRRWRVLALPARPLGRLAALRRARGRGGTRHLRPGRPALPALAQGRTAREDPAGRARGAQPRPGRAGGGRERGAHPMVSADQDAPLHRRSGRRPFADPAVRPRGQRARHGAGASHLGGAANRA